MVLETKLLFYPNIDELDQKFLGRSHQNLVEVTELSLQSLQMSPEILI